MLPVVPGSPAELAPPESQVQPVPPAAELPALDPCEEPHSLVQGQALLLSVLSEPPRSVLQAQQAAQVQPQQGQALSCARREIAFPKIQRPLP
jgi:hypothetical protein